MIKRRYNENQCNDRVEFANSLTVDERDVRGLTINDISAKEYLLTTFEETRLFQQLLRCNIGEIVVWELQHRIFERTERRSIV